MATWNFSVKQQTRTYSTHSCDPRRVTRRSRSRAPGTRFLKPRDPLRRVGPVDATATRILRTVQVFNAFAQVSRRMAAVHHPPPRIIVGLSRPRMAPQYAPLIRLWPLFHRSFRVRATKTQVGKSKKRTQQSMTSKPAHVREGMSSQHTFASRSPRVPMELTVLHPRILSSLYSVTVGSSPRLDFGGRSHWFMYCRFSLVSSLAVGAKAFRSSQFPLRTTRTSASKPQKSSSANRRAAEAPLDPSPSSAQALVRDVRVTTSSSSGPSSLGGAPAVAYGCTAHCCSS